MSTFDKLQAIHKRLAPTLGDFTLMLSKRTLSIAKLNAMAKELELASKEIQALAMKLVDNERPKD